jgi:hypothetical protein
MGFMIFALSPQKEEFWHDGCMYLGSGRFPTADFQAGLINLNRSIE